MKRYLCYAAALLILSLQFRAQGQPTIQTLFCAYGGTGIVPNPMPADFEAWFAVVVLEVETQNEIREARLSDFELIDNGRQTAKMKRVVRINEFNRPRTANEGEAAYYLNEGGTPSWDGKVPAGKIRLWIRVALDQQKHVPATRFRLTFGGRVVEGPVNVRWPT